jgi:hypothetical protein
MESYMTTNSLVLELQAKALDNNVVLCDLLRNALFISEKLDVLENISWIKNELYGYSNFKDIPSYREIRVELSVLSLYGKHIPIQFPNNEAENTFTKMKIFQPIVEMQQLSSSVSANNGMGVLEFPLSSEESRIFEKMLKTSRLIKRIAPNTVAHQICESVRTIILEWAITLEKKGILGEGVQFKSEDKERAKANNASVYNINTMQLFSGNNNKFKISQTLDFFNFSVEKDNPLSLKETLNKCGISDNDFNKLIEAIQIDPKLTTSKKYGEKVSEWIGNMVSKAAKGSLNITIDIAAEALSRYISQYIGMP